MLFLVLCYPTEGLTILFLVLRYPTEYREKYAKPEDIGAVTEEKSSDEELSDDDSDSSDEQVAGQADP